MAKRAVKQSTFVLITSGILLLSCLLLFFAAIMIKNAFNEVRLAENRKAQFEQLGLDLAGASDYLTDQARRYVIFGEKKYFDNYWREVNETQSRDQAVQKLQELKAPQSELDLIELAKENSDALIGTEEAAMQAVEQGDLQLAQSLMFGAEYDAGKEIIMGYEKQFQNEMTSRTAAELKAKQDVLFKYISLILFLALITAAMVAANAALIFKKIIRPLFLLKEHMLAMAQGDLTQTVPVKHDSSEMGQLAAAVDSTGQNIEMIIQNIKNTSSLLNDAAQLLLTQAQQTSAGANETASAMVQITSTVDQVATNIQTIAGDVGGIGESAVQGNQVAANLAAQMSVINDRSKELAIAFTRVGDSSREVNGIIEIIGGVADQTNLLALNAAIEAASAGENGKGFAVVAEEVRKLAAETAAATNDIRQLINNIQSETEQAAEMMTQTGQEIEAGNVISAQVQDNFEAIGDTTKKSVTDTQEVAAATEQMSAGVQNAAATTEEQTAAIEEIAAAAEKLENLAGSLNELIGRFKV